MSKPMLTLDMIREEAGESAADAFVNNCLSGGTGADPLKEVGPFGLMGGFAWKDTPEGSRYWLDIWWRIVSDKEESSD